MTFRKCMTALILFGVLLGGIGAGVGFAEYSAMEYQGHVILAEDEEATAHLIWDLEDNEYDVLRVYEYHHDNEITVIEDKKVPENEVWFDVTYGKDIADVFLDEMGIYEEPSGKAGTKKLVAGVGIFWSGAMETEEAVRLLVKCRDQILGELKEHKFSTYELDRTFDVKIRINPVNADKIDVMR